MFKKNPILSWAVVTAVVVAIMTVIEEVIYFSEGATLDGRCPEGCEIAYPKLFDANHNIAQETLVALCKDCGMLLLIELILIVLVFSAIKGLVVLKGKL